MSWITSGSGHRMICYDDEGSLECVCALRKSLEHAESESISRAEALELEK
jgi:hypothetical protein